MPNKSDNEKGLVGIIVGGGPAPGINGLISAATIEAINNGKKVVGILGGSAGTTHDAFDLVEQAKRYGARIALFGRKINAAEHQLAFVKCLRAVADDQLSAVEAVRAYHSELITLGISPNRSLADDLVSTRM